MKIARTDRELECPRIDAALRARGADLMLLPEGIADDDLAEAARDAALILMCYTPITARVIAALDLHSQEPLARHGHPLSALYAMDNVILLPHLTFYTREAMQRLEDEALERCFEILDGRPVRVKSRDPRLTSQRFGVAFR